MNYSDYIKLLDEKDEQVRIYASKKLSNLGNCNEATDITHYLSDSSGKVRLNLTMFLRKNPSKEITFSLLSRLEIESCPMVRSSLYKLIPLCCGLKGLTVVHNGLKEADPRVRANAVEALSLFPVDKVRDINERMLADPHFRVKTAALSVMNAFNLHGTGEKILQEYEASTDLKYRTALLFLMGTSRNHLYVDTLRQAAQSLDSNIRQMAVRSIKTYLNPDMTEFLLKRFYSEKSYTILNEIVNSLSANKEHVISVWKQGIPCDLDPITRANIARALGRLNTPDSINILLMLLNDQDPRVRANSLESLKEYRDSNYLVNLILPYLKDNHPRVKAAAAAILWKMGILNAAQTLKNMLKETNVVVQKSAAFVISSLGIF